MILSTERTDGKGEFLDEILDRVRVSAGGREVPHFVFFRAEASHDLDAGMAEGRKGQTPLSKELATGAILDWSDSIRATQLERLD